jgi:hypothetical protein
MGVNISAYRVLMRNFDGKIPIGRELYYSGA